MILQRTSLFSKSHPQQALTIGRLKPWQTVRDFLNEYAGLDWTKYVEADSRYFGPSEVPCLQGDASKARALVGWEPKVRFVDLVRMMVDYDMEVVGGEYTLAEAGHSLHITKNMRSYSMQPSAFSGPRRLSE